MPIVPRSSEHKENDVTYISTRGRKFNADVVRATVLPSTPAAPTVTPQGAAGTTTYRYRVSRVDEYGVESLASTGAQTTTGNATLSASNFNRVTWTAVPGTVSYNVYGRSGADGTHQRLASGITGLQFDDTGAVSPSGSLPTSPAADSFTLRVWYGAKKVFKGNVRRATNYVTADRYY